MATGRQVDYLFWAVAEARRQRAAEEERRVDADYLSRITSGLEDGFVTEWQSAEPASASL